MPDDTALAITVGVTTGPASTFRMCGLRVRAIAANRGARLRYGRGQRYHRRGCCWGQDNVGHRRNGYGLGLQWSR